MTIAIFNFSDTYFHELNSSFFCTLSVSYLESNYYYATGSAVIVAMQVILSLILC